MLMSLFRERDPPPGSRSWSRLVAPPEQVCGISMKLAGAVRDFNHGYRERSVLSLV